MNELDVKQRRWKRPPKTKAEPSERPICQNCGCVLKKKSDIFFWNGEIKCKECTGLVQSTIIGIIAEV